MCSSSSSAPYRPLGYTMLAKELCGAADGHVSKYMGPFLGAPFWGP